LKTSFFHNFGATDQERKIHNTEQAFHGGRPCAASLSPGRVAQGLWQVLEGAAARVKERAQPIAEEAGRP